MVSTRPCLVFVALLVASHSANESTWHISIDISTVIQEIPIPFYGFTFDYQGSSSWLNAGALTTNLSNPDLIALPSEVSPALLRIGGSAEDYVVYNISGECNYINSTQFCGTTGAKKGWTGCLNMSRWQEINQFATKCNLTLLYGINACYGRKSSDDEMDFDNIISFMNKTAEFIQNSDDFNNLYSFEFGNEISSKIDSDIYAKDYNQVYSIIHEKTKSLNHKSWLIGPDCMGHQAKYQWDQQFIAKLYDINNGSQDAVTQKLHRLTYHFYPKCEFLYSSNQTIFDLSCLQNISLYAKNYSHLAEISGTIAYMGEGAEYSHGGTPNVTNTFADSFYYVFQLCEVLKNGIKGTARSTLMGGSYELLDAETIRPNPDYWILYLWKQLIGYKMYDSNLTFVDGLNGDYVKGYVLQGKMTNGRETFVVPLINFHLSMNVKVEINMNNNSGYLYQQYILKGIGGNGLQTKTLMVNDIIMEYQDGKFPLLVPVSATSVIDVPAKQIVFAVITAKT